MTSLGLVVLFALSLAAPVGEAQAPTPGEATEELWQAARTGDEARAIKALERGADVNAKSRYGATALMFAADKGHLGLVKLLLERGADANAQDTFYRFRALDMAVMNNHAPVAVLLLQRGSQGAGNALRGGIQRGSPPVVEAALASPEITAEQIRLGLVAAKRGGNAEIVALLEKRAASMPAGTPAAAVTVDRAVLQTYVGTYQVESFSVAIALAGDQLTAAPSGQPVRTLVPTSATTFRMAELDGVSIAFSGRGGAIDTLALTQSNQTLTLARAPSSAAAPPPPAPAAAAPAPGAPDTPPAPARTAARPWPAFRGSNASGNGDGQGAVIEWNVDDGKNVRWKTAIPGIANASPIVWGNRVFVTTAISSAGDKTFRTGLYGDVAPVNDLSEHTWKIYGLDKATGKILWEQTAFTGVPKTKRHTKASQANSTPVTDGKRVVALFGTIGLLAAWDVDGKPLWTADLGVMDSGWFFDPTYQWGHSSSPIIHDGKVIVQADQQKGSYLAAYDVSTGKQIWRTDRDEISTWGTPTVFASEGRIQIVTNGTRIRSYDPASGALLWTLGPNSEITVGTPVVGDGLVFVTGGYPPVRPIYAIRPSATGEITMSGTQKSHEAIAWSNTGGTYIPTPLHYRGILYTFNSDSILSAYEAKTGERLYRARVGGGGSFAASPIAADGHLYFVNEDGDVIIARAGRSYEEVARIPMKEVIMSTPAISDGLLVIRTLGHVYGIGR